MTQVAIIDYGVGNLRSVEKAFAATGCDAIVTGNDRELRNAERLVLPGVGAFGACMQALTERGFDHLVRERVREGIPLLGVCVGMQMLFEESDEFGRTAGLGLLRGCVQRFSNDLVVPQVGWNQIRQRKIHTLFQHDHRRDRIWRHVRFGYSSLKYLRRAVSSRKKSGRGVAIAQKFCSVMNVRYASACRFVH